MMGDGLSKAEHLDVIVVHSEAAERASGRSLNAVIASVTCTLDARWAAGRVSVTRPYFDRLSRAQAVNLLPLPLSQQYV